MHVNTKRVRPAYWKRRRISVSIRKILTLFVLAYAMWLVVTETPGIISIVCYKPTAVGAPRKILVVSWQFWEIWFSVALRPQRRVGLLGTGTEWEGGERVKGSTAETARKRPERPWTAARTMEVLRRCPLAIAQRLVHCAIALSTAVLDRITKTMSVAPLLTNNLDNSKQKTSNLLSPAPPPYSWSLLGKVEGPAPPPSSKISWSRLEPCECVFGDLWRGQLWQWSEGGCRKPERGVCIALTTWSAMGLGHAEPSLLQFYVMCRDCVHWELKRHCRHRELTRHCIHWNVKVSIIVISIST